jgi:hypothetical protein
MRPLCRGKMTMFQPGRAKQVFVAEWRKAADDVRDPYRRRRCDVARYVDRADASCSPLTAPFETANKTVRDRPGDTRLLKLEDERTPSLSPTAQQLVRTRVESCEPHFGRWGKAWSLVGHRRARPKWTPPTPLQARRNRLPLTDHRTRRPGRPSQRSATMNSPPTSNRANPPGHEAQPPACATHVAVLRCLGGASTQVIGGRRHSVSAPSRLGQCWVMGGPIRRTGTLE